MVMLAPGVSKYNTWIFSTLKQFGLRSRVLTRLTYAQSLETENELYDCVGSVTAKQGCWSFLKGGFVLDSSSNLSLLFFQVKYIRLNITLL